MPDELEVIARELEEGPTGPKPLAVLKAAEANGFYANPFHSFVTRFAREGAVPVFARWDVGVTAGGRISYRFQGARAQNGQPLNYDDLLLYFEDPDIVLPEPPEEITETREESE